MVSSDSFSTIFKRRAVVFDQFCLHNDSKEICHSEDNMQKQKIIIPLILIGLVMISCNLPLIGAKPTSTPTETSSIPTNTLPFVATTDAPPTVQPPTATVEIPPTACTPQVKANTPVNIRSGPGTVYSIVNALAEGATTPVNGRNVESTWWYVGYPGGVGWISASVVTASCIPNNLTVVAAPPTPLPATGTCKDGYEYRLINASDKICVSAASKNQADADNAAADSRRSVVVFGTDACQEGYVWRDAFSGDRVCVAPAVRTQAATDNAAAASRWVAGAYGPHTCISGFVWREAQSGDDVCVTPETRTQTVSDNAAASSRVAGTYDCIGGYVWREAFSGDKVCVTPTVKSQVAADNAAAPSHTW